MNKKIACLLIFLTLTSILFASFNQTKAQTQPTVALNPPNLPVTQINQVITVNITISNVQNLWAWDMSISWDPTILTMTNTPIEGDFLSSVASTMFLPTPPNNGTISDISDTITSIEGANGSGVLATLQFKVIKQFTSTTINLNGISLESPTNTVTAPPITPTSTTATATVTYISGGAPSANAGPNQLVTEGSTVTLDGSSSLTSGSNPTYTWSFKDGTPKTLSGTTTTYTFNTPGIYTVTLTLTDSNGNSNSTAIITVQSTTTPVAKITIQGITEGQTIPKGQTVTLDGSASYEANNVTIQKYIWAASGGSGNTADVSEIGEGATITHTFANAGTYNVTLTVIDITNLNDTTSMIVKVGASSSNSGGGSDPFQTNIPPMDLAIVIIITVAVLGGSTFWLRKRV